MTEVDGGLSLDVLVQGEGTRRDVPVELSGTGLRVGEMDVPLSSVYWTSRRAGLLMVFAREHTLALKGGRGTLQRIARTLDRRLGQEAGRGRLPESLAGEVVVCTAGVAATGTLAGRPVRGLRVALFTRRGLHLLAGEEDLRLGWPVEDGRREEGRRGPRAGSGGPILRLRKEGTDIRLLYLFPEEIQAALRVALDEPEGPPVEDGPAPLEVPSPRPRPSPPPDSGRDEPEKADTTAAGAAAGADTPEGGSEEDEKGPPAGEVGEETAARDGDRDGADEDEPLELFARREVAGPTRPELPALQLSVETLQGEAETVAGRIPEEPARAAGLRPHFLETHFLELGEIALGPLLLRKSAAATAQSLERAMEALNATELREDTWAAVSNAAARLVEVYGRELDRLLEAKRAPAKVEEEHELDVEEREEIRLCLEAPFERLVPLLRDLEDRQEVLRDRLREVEEGPPDVDEEGLDRAREEWAGTLDRLDRAFEEAWREAVGEIGTIWKSRLLPRLAEVGRMRRRRLPEWVWVAAMAGLVLVVAAVVMILVAW